MRADVPEQCLAWSKHYSQWLLLLFFIPLAIWGRVALDFEILKHRPQTDGKNQSGSWRRVLPSEPACCVHTRCVGQRDPGPSQPCCRPWVCARPPGHVGVTLSGLQPQPPRLLVSLMNWCLKELLPSTLGGHGSSVREALCALTPGKASGRAGGRGHSRCCFTRRARPSVPHFSCHLPEVGLLPALGGHRVSGPRSHCW